MKSLWLSFEQKLGTDSAVHRPRHADAPEFDHGPDSDSNGIRKLRFRAALRSKLALERAALRSPGAVAPPWPLYCLHTRGRSRYDRYGEFEGFLSIRIAFTRGRQELSLLKDE